MILWQHNKKRWESGKKWRELKKRGKGMKGREDKSMGIVTNLFSQVVYYESIKLINYFSSRFEVRKKKEKKFSFRSWWWMSRILMRLTLACLTVSIATTSASAAFALGPLNLKGGSSKVAWVAWPTMSGYILHTKCKWIPNYVLKIFSTFPLIDLPPLPTILGALVSPDSHTIYVYIYI
jgi:hypothetical protein